MSYSEWEENQIIQQAKEILQKRLRTPLQIFTNHEAVKLYVRINYSELDTEHFGCLFLDAQYGLIDHKVLFMGSVNACATYPREIVRQALLHNAVFVILVHNHPSGSTTPSKDDILLTHTVKDLLAGVDICLYDHFIVAGDYLHSMRKVGTLT